MSEASTGAHSLSAVRAIWRSSSDEIKANETTELRDGVVVPPDELKKVAKWLQQLMTKFGAAAAVADGPTDKALMAIGEEVIAAFTATVQTLVCLSRGAGRCLVQEIAEIGSGLAQAFEETGAAAGSPSLATCVGKSLDRIKHLERIPAHNRAAIQRRLLSSLGSARDAQRELQEALQPRVDGGGGGGDGEDEDEECMASDAEMEPGERLLVEAIVAAIEALLSVLTEASTSCIPAPTSPTSAGGGGGGALGEDPAALSALEATAEYASEAAKAVDGMAAHAVGGLDVKAFQESLAEMRAAAKGLGGGDALPAALDCVQAALDAVPSD